ncbi:MAG: hypothetical protein F2825_00200 [Actinobacteria bacterium]|uniref:Unannotated protein n=1 Tax=freshwater metagenome TaxID=449393 RepID=A0A6J7FXB0_9ZZZZ|nr:hypothetical protein [Actinomycetota bacterium]
MSGWGRHLDELAAAVTDLLVDGAVPDSPLGDPHAAFAARDTVLVELRELVGAVADAPQFAEVRPLTLHDAVHRPAQALHQALSELPRAGTFGDVELAAVDDKTLPGYERAWQRAARASLSLEGYLDGLGRLPDHHAWDVLRDLTDLAAALPYLDHDLSEAVLPRLKSGEDFGVQYRMLTHAGHDALRLVSSEVRARVPAAEPAGRTATQPSRPAQRAVQASVQALAQPAPRPPRRDPDRRMTAVRGPDGAGELSAAMTRYTHAVSVRSAHLSVPDLRAVTRLLEMGCAHASRVLDRVAPAVAGAADAAAGLRAVAPLSEALRDVPAKSMTPPHLDLLREGTELQLRMAALAGQALRLPGGAAEHDLRRLAVPALEFAQHVPALAGALDLSVREAVAAKLMLIPGVADPRSSTASTWVTATMGPRRDGPPAVVTAAGELSVTARRIAPALRRAGEDLLRSAAVPPTPTQQATIAARRYAGAARVELRQALTDRTARQPAPLAPALPAHPRSAPPRAVGPHR